MAKAKRSSTNYAKRALSMVYAAGSQSGALAKVVREGGRWRRY